MESKIWNKYTKVKKINKNSNIKTYLARFEPIVKEIEYKNMNEYCKIRERIDRIENKIKIYDLIEEKDRIYIVIDKNDNNIDKLLLSDEEIKKEIILQGHGSPVRVEDLMKLLNMENAMCKIECKKYSEGGKPGIGTGFFCKLNNFPIKYALFTNNHVFDEDNINIDKKINIGFNKTIKIDKERRVFTNKELDYTCIELKKSDKINCFYEIDPILFTDKKNCIKDSDIFILQYPEGNKLCFSSGKIISLQDNYIIHSASTRDGSSGSPIIIRSYENYIIGLHSGSNNYSINNSFNIGIIFDSILNDIKKNNICNQVNNNSNNNNKLNVIKCIYKLKNDDKNQIIDLLHDYDITDFYIWNERYTQLYLEAKEINKKIFENNIDIYINGDKIPFTYKYNINNNKEIKVKFIFRQNLTNLSGMFLNCSSLKSIDLSSFNTNNATNMSGMFFECSSLKSIDFSSFNTNNATNMCGMFFNCGSLNSINLSSFNTRNVTDMSGMFLGCKSLNSINLSSFNTRNVTDMSGMFLECESLNSIHLSLNFTTSNVTNMIGMFYKCKFLNSINLSSFNTSNAEDMSWMFSDCSSLKSIDLSSFNTSNVKDMNHMFSHCSSLKSIDLSSFNTSNVKEMRWMFFGCSSLNKKNIKTYDKQLLNQLEEDLIK